MLLLRQWGTLSLRDVMQYAIGYAHNGHPVSSRVAAAIELLAEHFRASWPTSYQLWLLHGRPPAAGALLQNRMLAATYQRIVEEAERRSPDREGQIEAARSLFYEGFVAEAIDKFARTQCLMDISGARHSGLIRGDDLAGWHATVERPLSIDHRGLTVCKPGPWTQGPVFLQQLRLLENFDLDAGWDPVSADLVHTTMECAKLAFADREAFYGDPRHVDVPLDDLLSVEYSRHRSRLVGDTASQDLRPGSPGGRAPTLPRYPDSAQYAVDSAQGVVTNGRLHAASAQGLVRGDTCHVDVVDRFGNVVAATPSGGWLQSSPIVDGLGFALGTRGEMFWLQQGLANSLVPGKRPRTTLTPSLVLRDGEPVLAFGTPGGDQQDQWTLLFFLRQLHHEPNLQRALDAPMWHTTHFPSSFYPRTSHPGELHVERRVGKETLDELRSRGHLVVEEPEWSLGHTTVVSRDHDGIMHAAANPRGMQAYAVGR